MSCACDRVNLTTADRKNKPPRAISRRRPTLGALAALGLLVLLMLYPDAVVAAMQRGLQRCALRVVPALFPFLVVSELLVRSRVGELFPPMLLRPVCRLFRISHYGALCWVMGVLCGFPVGMRAAAAYARQGLISQEELGHLLCFCNVPGSAFLINAVGLSLMGSVRYGRALLLLCLLSSALVGAVLGRMHRAEVSLTLEASAPRMEDTGRNRVSTLSEALAGAASGMLGIVATVCFFAALLGAVFSLPLPLIDCGLPRAILAGLLEITSGVCEAVTLGDGMLTAVTCAAVAGWAGLSVHCQLIAVCEGFSLPLGRFFVARLLQAALCGAGMALLWRLGAVDILRGGSSTESALLLRGGGGEEAWLCYALLCAVAWVVAGVVGACHGKRRRVRTDEQARA